MPKPIRLTKRRALALLTVFESGRQHEHDWIVSEIQDSHDLERIRAAKERDLLLAAALDAAAIVRARYLDGPVPTAPSDTLF